MPFLRVIRDKRGYETTYLMHWYRENGRQRSRILYLFRTPGGVRVGREPLTPDILRQIEAHHPDIAFDWNIVRDNQQVVDSAPDERRRRPRRDQPPPPPAPAPDAAPAAAAPSVERRSAAAPAPPQAPPRPVIPPTIEGTTADEQLEFLARWYGVIREQIPTRVADPARRDAFFALAERLNTASWIDADQIAAGLPAAAEALERLSRLFSKRRRRPRKRPAPGGAPGAAEAAASGSAAAREDVPDDAESDDEAGPESESESESESETESDPDPSSGES